MIFNLIKDYYGLHRLKTEEFLVLKENFIKI